MWHGAYWLLLAADSTGRRNTLTTAQAEEVLHMKYRTRKYYTAAQKALIWERWRAGWTLHETGKLFDRPHTSIQNILSKTGGIRPPERQRGSIALTLEEREEISRALIVGQSMRSIAARLGRAPSTISREIERNIQARGALKKELLEHLRRTRGMRRSRAYTQKTAIHGQIVDAVSISERPASVEGRAVPGHWEGNLVFGGGNSQIATLVERQTIEREAAQDARLPDARRAIQRMCCADRLNPPCTAASHPNLTPPHPPPAAPTAAHRRHPAPAAPHAAPAPRCGRGPAAGSRRRGARCPGGGPR